MKTKQFYTLCIAFILACMTNILSAQWVKQNIPRTETDLYYLHSTDKNSLWSFTRVPVADSANPKKVELIRTGDGGKTYKKTTLFPVAGDVFVHVEPMDGKNAHMIYATNQGEFGLKRTTDSGATWQNLGWQPQTFPDVVYFWDLNNGIVATDPDSLGMVVMYTIDGGKTFQRVPQVNLPRINSAEEFGLINEFQVVGNTVFMDIFNFVTGEDRYWRSLDRGRNWTAGASFSNNSLYTSRIAFSDNNNGMVLRGITRETQKPLYTTDGGNTWKEAEGNLPSYVDWGIDNVPNTSSFVALFQDTVRRVLFSSLTNDFGKTWNTRKDLYPYVLDSSFVQFGGSPMVFSYIKVIDNNAAWGKFGINDLYRYDSPTPIVPEKPDLELTITADKDGLPLWDYVKFTLTIKNRGISRATGIKANWLPPYKRTDNGGEAFANVGAYSSKGNYNWWTGDWNINELAAGESATANFHLFVVKSGANVTQTAQITACNESDLDSSPNNMSANKPNEDDETSFTSLRATSFGEPIPNSTPSVLALKISPNPAKEKAFLAINDKNETVWAIEVVNSLGQVVFSKNEQQNGLLELNTEGYKNGLYLVHLTNGTEKRVEKFMVQH